MSRILLTENSAAPATPAAGKVALYAKNDGLLYAKDDTGAETTLGGATNATSVGDGDDLYTGVVDGTLQFRSLSAGTGISLDVGEDGSLEVSVTGGGEEATTVANLGMGEVEVYAGMDGTEIQLRTLKQGTNVSLSVGDDGSIEIAAAGGDGTATLQSAYDEGNYVGIQGETPVEFRLLSTGTALDLSVLPAVEPASYAYATVLKSTGIAVAPAGVGNVYAAQFVGDILLAEDEAHTAAAAPTPVVLRTVRGKNVADLAGGDLHVEIGGGTGAGDPGAFLVSGTVPTTSGTTAQSRTTMATFTGDELGTHLRLDDRLLLEMRATVPATEDVDPEGTAGTLLSGSDGELYYVSPTGDATRLTDAGTVSGDAASLQSAYDVDEHILVTTAPITVEAMNPVTAMSLSVATIVTPTEATALLYVNGFVNVSHEPGTPTYYAAHFYGDLLLGAGEVHESGTPDSAVLRTSTGATGTDLAGGDLRVEIGGGTGVGDPGAFHVSNTVPTVSGDGSQYRKLTATFTGDALGTHLRLDDRLLLEMRNTVPSSADVDPEGTAGTLLSGSDGELYYVSPIGDTLRMTVSGSSPMTYDSSATPEPAVENTVPYTNEDGTSGSTNSSYVGNQLVVAAQESIKAGLQIKSYASNVEYTTDPWVDLADQVGATLAQMGYNASENQVSIGTRPRPANQPANILVYADSASNNSSGPSAGLRAGGGGPGTAGGQGNDGGSVMLRPGPKGATPANGTPGKDGAVQLFSADGAQNALLAVGSDGELRFIVGQSNARTNLAASKLGRQAFRNRMVSVGQGTFLFPDWAPTNGQVIGVRVYQLSQNNNAQVTAFQLRVRKFTGAQAINNTFDQGVNLLTQDFVDLATMPAGTVQTFALTASGPDKQFNEGDRWAFQVKADGAVPNASNLLFELLFQAN